MYKDQITSISQEVESMKKETAKDVSLLREIQNAVNARGSDPTAYQADEAEKADRIRSAMNDRKKLIRQKEEAIGRLADIDEGEEMARQSTNPAIKVDPVRRALYEADDEQKEAFYRFINSKGKDTTYAERYSRALNVGSASAGLEAIPPTEFLNEFWADVKRTNIIRSLATIRPLSTSYNMTVPTVPTRITRPVFKTTDTATSDLDSGLTTGSRVLTPNKLPVEIRVSNYWLAIGGAAASNIVREEMAAATAESLSHYYCVGDGSNEPLGLFVASTSGIPVSRDVQINGGGNAFTYQGLVETYYNVPGRYRNSTSCVWLLSDEAESKLAGMVDQNDRPVFIQSLSAGVPNTLFGKPIVNDESVPAVFTANQYIGMFGDLKGYLIADGPNFGLQAIANVVDGSGHYTDETAFRTVIWTDGVPMTVRANGFSRMQSTGS